MARVNDILAFIDTLAPFELQLDFDNAGLQIGYTDAEVSKALVSLDITDEVVDEAIGKGVQLIVSHHPLIFRPVKRVSSEDLTGRKLLKLAENRISVISAHTNLDIAEGGVNDVLISLLGAKCECALDAADCGRVGELPEEMTISDFLSRCRDVLYTEGLRYIDSGRAVKRIAVLGGAGADAIEDAVRLGCDTFVTSDIKYHQFLNARELGINIIDGEHFGTENPVIPKLAAALSGHFGNVEFTVSEKHAQAVSFYFI